MIAGDTNGPSDGVYFVRRGLCDIVRRIVLVRHQSPYLRPNILLPQTAAKRQNFLNKTYSRGRRLRRDEVRFITVTTLQPGNYFGAGQPECYDMQQLFFVYFHECNAGTYPHPSSLFVCTKSRTDWRQCVYTRHNSYHNPGLALAPQ